MAVLTWILTVLCVTGGHLSSSSYALCSALVVQSGQNVSLTCNLTSSSGVTWYHLHSDEFLPLLTVTLSRVGNDMVNFHTNCCRINNFGTLRSMQVGLEIADVEKTDTGLYFCARNCTESVFCVNRGIHLAVEGIDQDAGQQPCWTLGICVAPAWIVLFLVIVGGLFVFSVVGLYKTAVCCCNSVSSDASVNITAEENLHYSSLRLADLPRPSGQRQTGLVKEDVIYSIITSGKSRN